MTHVLIEIDYTGLRRVAAVGIKSTDQHREALQFLDAIRPALSVLEKAAKKVPSEKS